MEEPLNLISLIDKSGVESCRPTIASSIRSTDPIMEEPLNLISLIGMSGGESCRLSIASNIRSTNPLEHHRLLCLAASSFTLWWQLPFSATKKRKRVVLAEEESAPLINHPKRRKLDKDKNNEHCHGLSLGLSPVSSTTPPSNDDQLDHEIRDNQVAEKDDENNQPKKASGHDQIRPVVVQRSDPALFNIKKKLVRSDVRDNCSLLVPKALVESHILPNFDKDLAEEMGSEEGLQVSVLDEDRQKDYNMIFKHLKSSNSFYFNRTWRRQFVNLLNLNENDEIGLYLDTTSPSHKPRFRFSLLKRAGQAVEVAPALLQK